MSKKEFTERLKRCCNDWEHIFFNITKIEILYDQLINSVKEDRKNRFKNVNDLIGIE